MRLPAGGCRSRSGGGLMRKLSACVLLALTTAGCMNPHAIGQGVKNLGRRMEPTARKIETGSRRLVSAAGQAADDATLAARVRTVLMTRKEIDGRKIHVRVEDGA